MCAKVTNKKSVGLLGLNTSTVEKGSMSILEIEASFPEKRNYMTQTRIENMEILDRGG